jgi:hypothetical protein
MRSSLPALIVLSAALGASACAPTSTRGVLGFSKPRKLAKHKPPAPPLYGARTATLNVTFGIGVVAISTLPSDFIPDSSRPPLWLRSGSEVGVVGAVDGKTVLLGYGGAYLVEHSVIVGDFGETPPDYRLLDIAASPDGNRIATATTQSGKLELKLRTLDKPDQTPSTPIITLDGDFDAAQLTWLDNGQLALFALDDNASTQTVAADRRFYLIKLGENVSIRHLDKIKCPLSPLSFSPDQSLALAVGDSSAPPVLIDIHHQTCMAPGLPGPVRMLGWAPDSTAFLYVGDAPSGPGSGVFRYDVKSGQIATIAVSSAAASYASDRTIIAAGNQSLTWQGLADQPNRKVKAEVALFDPNLSQITINSLGFETSPWLLAHSSMVFSQASDDGIIDTALPEPSGLLRSLIEYSYPARAAFVIASGPVRGRVTMSWSPHGGLIAIVDGDSNKRTLEVLVPPR